MRRSYQLPLPGGLRRRDFPPWKADRFGDEDDDGLVVYSFYRRRRDGIDYRAVIPDDNNACDELAPFHVIDYTFSRAFLNRNPGRFSWVSGSEGDYFWWDQFDYDRKARFWAGLASGLANHRPRGAQVRRRRCRWIPLAVPRRVVGLDGESLRLLRASEARMARNNGLSPPAAARRSNPLLAQRYLP